MMRALFTAASGMIVQERKQANVVNNLANIQTTGFKTEEIIAKEAHKATIQNRERTSSGKSYMRELGELGFGARVDKLFIDFKQGLLEETNKNTDFAIDGEGFFKIQWNDNEIGYTRNGQFQINEEGYLCTMEGKRVLGKNEVPIRTGYGEITVNPQGEIFVNGDKKNSFDIVTFETVDELNPMGESTYKIENGVEITAKDAQVMQKQLEKSNVDPLEEMVKMIEISRSYESNQKIIQSLDRVLDKSVNQVGKV